MTEAAYIGAGIFGKKLADGPAPGSLGAIDIGRPATETNLRAARQHWMELRASDFRSFDGGWADLGGGMIFDELRHDPLLLDNPGDQADAFAVWGGTIRFLKSRGTTVEQVERDRADAQRRADDDAENLDKFRAKQRQVTLRLGDLPDSESTPTLRRAAELIESLGGRVAVDDRGQLVCSIPERLSPQAATWPESIVERENRFAAARAAQVLRHGEQLVLAALERARKNEPVASLLPDQSPPL